MTSNIKTYNIRVITNVTITNKGKLGSGGVEMWAYIIIGFCLMWVFQIVLSSQQLKHYQKTIKEMSKGKTGYLGVGVDKRKLGVGTVVIIVCDENQVVTESKKLEGVTVFQRFTTYKDIIGSDLKSLFKESTEKESVAIMRAIEQINTQISK